MSRAILRSLATTVALLSLTGCAQVLQRANSLTDSAVRGSVDAVTRDPGKLKTAYDTLVDLNRDLTEEQEHYLGRAVAAKVLLAHRNKYLDKAAIARKRLAGATEYVSQVGALVAATAAEEAGDEVRLPFSGWHFVVLEADEIAAYAAPAGFVFVTTGALRAAQTEDELACLIAHEVVHVLHGHGLKTVKKARFANMSSGLLKKAASKLTVAELGQLVEAFNGSIDDVTEAVFTKGYSRSTELDADLLGAQAAAKAGYNPKAMVEYLRTAQQAQKGESGGFFSSHPDFADRIAELQDELKARPVAASSERAVRFAAFKKAL